MVDRHTFVIPVYGQSPYLEDCLKSLLNQSVAGEVLITTSTPSAFTQSIAKQYQVPYLVNALSSSGIAGDWNFALSVAATPWVTLAHQDDIYHTNYRRDVLEATQKSNNPLIAFTNYNELVDKEQRHSTANLLIKRLLLSPFKFNRSIRSKRLKKLMLMPGCPICCPSVAFHKPMLKGFEFSSLYKCALDWEAWLQLADKEGPFVYVNKQLVQHRIHQQSETIVNLNNGVRQAEEKQLLQQLWGKWLSAPISKVYALGHKANTV